MKTSKMSIFKQVHSTTLQQYVKGLCPYFDIPGVKSVSDAKV